MATHAPIKPLPGFPSLPTDPEPVPGIDPNSTAIARMYDFYLGGKHNYPADRAAGTFILNSVPLMVESVRENRAFLRRAVHYMVAQGIRQFIDIGSGLPTAGNTHEIAQSAIPVGESVKVVYVDYDPLVVAMAASIVKQGTAPEGCVTRCIQGDAKDIPSIFAHPEVAATLDYNQPIGVLCLALFHFFTVEETSVSMTAIRARLPSGSLMAITHAVDLGIKNWEVLREIYRRNGSDVITKPREEIEAILTGFEMLEPGLVPAAKWRPDGESNEEFNLIWSAMGRVL